MTAVLLKGASWPADPACALCTEVERQLAAQFDTVRSLHLAGCDIGHCMGEFDCFVKTPGRCRIHDEGQEIERAVHDAELVVLVTPLHDGGRAAQLKKARDRLLRLILPFSRKVGGLDARGLRAADRLSTPAAAQGHRAADEPAAGRGRHVAGDLEPSPAAVGSRGGAGRGRRGDWVRSRCGGGASGRTSGARRLVPIAGGSGIVPLQAVARQVLHGEPDAAITRVQGSSALERAIFAAPLQPLALHPTEP